MKNLDATKLEDALELAESSDKWDRYRACPRLVEEITALRAKLEIARTALEKIGGQNGTNSVANQALRAIKRKGETGAEFTARVGKKEGKLFAGSPFPIEEEK